MTDALKNLPDSREPLSNEEMTVLKDIFQSGQQSGVTSVKMYRPLIYGLLYFVLSLPITDKFIKSLMNTTDLVLIGIKTALFVLIIYILGIFGF